MWPMPQQVKMLCCFMGSLRTIKWRCPMVTNHHWEMDLLLTAALHQRPPRGPAQGEFPPTVRLVYEGGGHLHPCLSKQKAEGEEVVIAEMVMGVTWPWPLVMMELLKGHQWTWLLQKEPKEDGAKVQESAFTIWQGLLIDLHPVLAVGLSWSRHTVAKEHKKVPLNDSKSASRVK